MNAEARAAAVVQAAVERRIAPAVTAEVGTRRDVLWRASFGRLTFDESAGPATDETVYDLASLTKPIVTTSVTLDLIGKRVLNLGDRVETCFPEWVGSDRSGVTVRDLLEHASGLAPRLVDRPPATRREFEHDICVSPLEYSPRTQSVYSDLGFILLGFLAADRSGLPLDRHFASITAEVIPSYEPLAFDVSSTPRERLAPTSPLPEDQRTGRLLVGEVHDNYAAALGGVAGHAGLFGSAGGVGAFARVMLRALAHDTSLAPFTTDLVSLATTKSAVPNSSRALGWDTMLTTSSCGTLMSPRAFGHVGFTGTSLWIDPMRDRYFVLLTNRACQGGTLDEMRELRRAFHDAAADI